MELELQGVSHEFAGEPILGSIDLAVPSGEILCLVGPSGCGKSTLLKILGGLLQPAKGSALIKGEIPENCLNPLTYIFQDLALLPWRTVRENVSFALEHHRLNRRERTGIVDDMLRRTGLTNASEKLPGQLSGGMRQRVAIARALAVRPACLLMDEPLSALDGSTRQMLIDDFIGLWAQAAFTAVYVTHNIDEAVRLGHRIAVMSPHPGRITHMMRLKRPLADRQNDQSYIEKNVKKLRAFSRQAAEEAHG